MAMEKYVYGNKLVYEKEAIDGMYFLNDRLDRECAEPFFEFAKRHGEVVFKDMSGRKYSMMHENGAYVLTRKD